MSARHRKVYVVCRKTGYPLHVYPGHESGRRDAINKAAWLHAEWKAHGINDEPVVRRFIVAGREPEGSE